MKVIFKNLHIVNFMSFGESEIKLNDNGFVSISGQNNKITDLAESNGSGKSSIWESLFWCLTGSTVRGAKDICNHNIDDGCYVELDFNIDKDCYKIIRSKDHSKYKTNLQIFINGENKSGKGIRDSEKLLSEYLPDLNAQLLGSVILLGQGLPQRFTNNTPAGRKEVLEKLSKSDFMIEDIKNRLANRTGQLNKELRTEEDKLLELSTRLNDCQKIIIDSKSRLENMTGIDELNFKLNTLDEKKETYTEDYNKLINELTTLEKQIAENINNSKDLQNSLNYIISERNNKILAATKDIDSEILNLNAEVKSIQSKILSLKVVHVNTVITPDNVNELKKKFEDELESLNNAISSANNELRRLAEEGTKLTSKKVDISNTYNANLTGKELADMQENYNKLTAKYYALDSDIKSKKNVSDICPTCGQKLPDAHKIDTTELEKELEDIKNKSVTLYESINSKKKLFVDEYNKGLADIDGQLDKIKEDYNNKVNKVTELNNNISNINDELINIESFNLNIEYNTALDKLDFTNKEKEKLSEEVKNKYQKKESELRDQIDNLGSEYKTILVQKNADESQKRTYEHLLNTLTEDIANIKIQINKYNTEHDLLLNNIKLQEDTIKDINSKTLYINSEKEITQKHQEVINKFNTVVKRDFRGYLLSNSIEFINKRAKEYCRDIFDTTEIEFKLDGNNISISYSGKEYESLSGGERQKIDLLVQFALRDMLCTFLNFSSNILVLDEITDNLDALGCQRVINFISRKLSDVESTYIISHRKDLDIPYDRQLIVNKSNEGISSIEFGLM